MVEKSTDIVDVLIIGAGASGLTLGNVLAKQKINFIIIDSLTARAPLTKATGLHINSLRLLYQLDARLVEDEILPNSNELTSLETIVDFGEPTVITIKEGQLPFEKNIILSQFELEKILEARIKDKILYHHALLEFEESPDAVKALVKDTLTGEEKWFNAKFLVGADGVISKTRSLLGIPFEGESDPLESVIFEAVIKDFPPEKLSRETVFVTNKEPLIVVPLNKRNSKGDLIFKFRAKISDENFDKENQIDSICDIVKKRSTYEILKETISGIGFYRVESRLSTSIGTNRVSLIGDAAHSYFPIGAYALNLCIEDAFMLGWRLKLALQGEKEDWLRHVKQFQKECLQNARQIYDDVMKRRTPAPITKEDRVIKEVLIYEEPTKEGLSRLALLLETQNECFKNVSQELQISFYKGFGWKFLLSTRGVAYFEKKLKEKGQETTIECFVFGIESDFDFIAYVRPCLFGKMFYLETRKDLKTFEGEIDKFIEYFFTCKNI